MHLYSHLISARELRPWLEPRDEAEYYWGAIAADVRYLARLPRRRTHPALEAAAGWAEKYPARRDFGLGYLAHVLADERDAAGFLYDGIPWRWLRRRLSRPLAAAALELALTDAARAWPAAERLALRVSGEYNEILAGLGVPEAAAEAYARAANAYIAEPSFAAAQGLFRGLGLGGNARLARYLRWAGLVERSPLLRKFLVGGVDLGRLMGRITADLVGHYPPPAPP